MPDDQRIATNMRLFYILDVLAQKQSALTPSQINMQLEWPKQTVHRLCKSMVEEGFLQYDASGKKLLPSPTLRTIANGLLTSDWQASAKHQILEKLSSKVKETVNFVVPENPGMTYQDRVQTNWAFQIHLPIGSHVPFYCTASGKTYLASLQPKHRTAMAESLHYQPLTVNTVTDAKTLLKELNLVKKRGFAIDNEEFYEGMIAIAVPILDPAGRYHGALAVHGPTQRLSLDTLSQFYPDIRAAADQLSELIFSV